LNKIVKGFCNNNGLKFEDFEDIEDSRFTLYENSIDLIDSYLELMEIELPTGFYIDYEKTMKDIVALNNIYEYNNYYIS